MSGMTPEEADKAQHWAGMDGATAFQLIERHADGWGDVREMMDAWLRANTEPLRQRVRELEDGVIEIMGDSLEAIHQKRARKAQDEPVAPLSRHSQAMLLNVLWHHQGGSSPVGQPLRKILGIGQHDHLSGEQLSEAKWIDSLLASGTPEGWQQWVYEVKEYLNDCLETPGKLESMGSIDARKLLAAAPKPGE